MAGVSESVLRRALRERTSERTPQIPPSAHIPDAEDEPADEATFDADAGDLGDPLELARDLLRRTRAAVRLLPADSPRINPARAEERGLIKLIATLEDRRGAQETPEEVAARRRREDAETRTRMLRYVEEYEAEAREKGVCVHCGQAVPR